MSRHSHTSLKNWYNVETTILRKLESGLTKALPFVPNDKLILQELGSQNFGDVFMHDLHCKTCSAPAQPCMAQIALAVTAKKMEQNRG